jgi:hypothetical protein
MNSRRLIGHPRRQPQSQSSSLSRWAVGGEARNWLALPRRAGESVRPLGFLMGCAGWPWEQLAEQNNLGACTGPFYASSTRRVLRKNDFQKLQ